MSQLRRTLLTLLPAIALLAGCKSSPPKSYYLYTTDLAVVWIECTTVGNRIEGNMWVDEMDRFDNGEINGDIKNIKLPFDAELEGETLRVIRKADPTSKDPQIYAQMGTLKGDTLTLDEMQFHLASRVECFEASRKLFTRAHDTAKAIRAKKQDAQAK